MVQNWYWKLEGGVSELSVQPARLSFINDGTREDCCADPCNLVRLIEFSKAGRGPKTMNFVVRGLLSS